MELKYKLATDSKSVIPSRKSEGSLGKKIKLVTNCFNVDIPSGYVYHYDIEITCTARNIEIEENARSERGPKSDFTSKSPVPYSAEKREQNRQYSSVSMNLRRKVIQLMLERNRIFMGLYAAYDGCKNLYTRDKLKCKIFPLKCDVQMTNPKTVNDPDGTRTDLYQVVVKPVKKKETDSCAINLDSLHAFFLGKATRIPQEVVAVVEAILRQSPFLKHGALLRALKQSFFYPPNPQDLHPLGGGKEAWFGYHLYVLLNKRQPIVNLDITATIFYEKGPVIKFMASVLNTSVEKLRQKTHLSVLEIKRLTTELKNMRIETNYLQNYKKEYRIVRLTAVRAFDINFKVTINGKKRKMNAVEYYRMQHNITLEFPHLPCLQVYPESKSIYLPIEVCDIIERQHCIKKLEEKQNAKMNSFTARKPTDRFLEIENVARSDFAGDPYLREFEIKIDPRPLSLEGKVIESPSVRYRNEQSIKPRNGFWSMQDKQFLCPAKIGSWVLLSFANERCCSRQDLSTFAQVLCNVAKATGISISHPSLINIVDYRRVKISNIFQILKVTRKADFIVAVLPGDNKSAYGEIKQAAETVVGLITQCIMPDSVKKCTLSLVRNLCQKINIKMGGVNNFLSLEPKPTINEAPAIVIAVHVLRPNLFSRTNCSIVSSVGSLDADQSRYAVFINTQNLITKKRRNLEIIRELKTIVVSLLKAFFRNTNGKKPENIILYRSSLSKSQLKNAQETEVKYVREACKEFSESYEPGITFIAVQKCNRVRFMPENEKDGVGKMKNIPPGTVIDNTVTDPLYQDFLICSHLTQQGTSQPTRYIVLENDTKMTIEELQKLTFDLCHSYAPGTNSISTPAPVRYARLAAHRARRHLQCYEETCDGFESIPAETVLKVLKVADALKDTMYFV